MGKFVIFTSIIGLVADVITIYLFLANPPSVSVQLPGLSVHLGQPEFIVLTGVVLVYGLSGLSYVIVKPFRRKYVRIAGTRIERRVALVVSLVSFPVVLMWMKLLLDSLGTGTDRSSPPESAEELQLFAWFFAVFLTCMALWGASKISVSIGEALYDIFE
jgi:hypothetical protein